jgi:hypothetical protein
MKARHVFKMVAFVALALTMRPETAMAQEFAKPMMDNIIKTLIRMKAVDINRDEIVDLYARVTDCNTYLNNYKNDFEWEKIRTKLREDIRNNVQKFPVAYAYETMVKLGRYDFSRKLYPFVGDGGEINVNTFTMVVNDKNFCSNEKSSWLPTFYKLVLDKPIKLPGLYLSEEDGRDLMTRMEAAKNLTHLVYMRVNVRITYVAGLATNKEISAAIRKRRMDKYRRNASVVLQDVKGNAIQLDSRLESIQYYEDEGHTKLIYTYTP